MENQLKLNKRNLMKHIIIILCVIAGICSSCNDMLENIQPYLNEGETIYVGKVDSLTASSGRNRILRISSVQVQPAVEEAEDLCQ